MNVEALNNIWSQIKLLKSDVYVVNGNLAIGATADLNIVRCMYVYNPYNLMISTCKTNLDNFLKGKEELEYVPYFLNFLMKKCKYLSMMRAYTRPNFTIDNLREDEAFEGINNGWKTSNGVYKYGINNVFMSLYKSLLGMNKGDIVQLNVYEQQYNYICIFTIFKKKEKVVIDHFVNYLKV